MSIDKQEPTEQYPVTLDTDLTKPSVTAPGFGAYDTLDPLRDRGVSSARQGCCSRRRLRHRQRGGAHGPAGRASHRMAGHRPHRARNRHATRRCSSS